MDSARSGAVTDGCSCKASSNGPRGIPGATVGVAVAGEARTTREGGAPDMSDNETRTGSDVRAGAVASGDGFGSPWQRPCLAEGLGLTTSSACLFDHKLC